MPNKKITKKKASKKKTAKKKATKKKSSKKNVVKKKKKINQKKNTKAAPEVPIPPSLQKHGIKRVTDNMPEGSRLDVSAGVFMAFFGPALLEHYSRDNKDKK